MGCIRQRQGDIKGPPVYLYADHSIGRAKDCHLILNRASVSGAHARIRWDGESWRLRDLASRNGTYLNGSLQRGHDWVALRSGDEMVFGDAAETWVLVDDEAPRPLLIPFGVEFDVEDVITLSSLHAFPGHEEPRVTIFENNEGRYVLECEEEPPIVLKSGTRVDIEGTLFAVHLPRDPDAHLSFTHSSEVAPVTISMQTMRVTVNVAADEETAEVYIVAGSVRAHLPARVHLYLLSYLARQRVAKNADDGWVATELVCRELNMTKVQLGVQVYRIRDDFRKLGLPDAGAIVDRERRGWLRIGLGAKQITLGKM